MDRRYRIVAYVLGLFLLVAAGLKSWGFDAPSQDSFAVLSSPLLQTATIEVEVLVGIWLLSPIAPRQARAAALALFAALAAVSGTLAVSGAKSCGCFGNNLSVNPWYTTVINILAVAALMRWRPGGPGMAATMFKPAVWHPVSRLVLGVCALSIAASAAMTWAYGSPFRAVALLRGESIEASPTWNDVGDVEPGGVRWFTVELTNHETGPRRIIGGTSDCRCVTTEDLPVVISAGERARIRIRVNAPASPGAFRKAVVLFTEDDTVVTLRVAGRSVAEQ
jgi:hypothetical protein